MNFVYKNLHRLIILLAFPLGMCFGQDEISVPSMDSLAKFVSIPDDEAFQLLGLPQDKVQQPGTISSFLASITSAIDAKGILSPGIGISIAPYQLLMGDKLQLSDYVTHWWTRALSNTQISLGTAPTREADSSQDWGVGLRFVFLNSGDGRLDTNYINQLISSAQEVFNATPFPDNGSKIPKSFMELHEKAEKLIVKVNNAIKPNNSNSAIIGQITPFLDALDSIAYQMDTSSDFKKNCPNSNGALRQYVAKYRQPSTIENLLRLRKARESIDSIRNGKLSSKWNSYSLDFNIGTIYKTKATNISQSAFKNLQAWISGGIGIFDHFQLLAQLGVFHEFSLLGQGDSTFMSSGFMARGGTKDFRIGIGINGSNNFSSIDRGEVNVVTEFHLNQKAWIVPAINWQFARGMLPIVYPSISIKATDGVLGL